MDAEAEEVFVDSQKNSTRVTFSNDFTTTYTTRTPYDIYVNPYQETTTTKVIVNPFEQQNISGNTKTHSSIIMPSSLVNNSNPFDGNNKANLSNHHQGMMFVSS